MRSELILVLMFAASAGAASGASASIVLEIDLVPGAGDGLLTRDTVQGLDFLDLTQTVGRSFNDISSSLGPGQLFEGFRIASFNEVGNLAENFGFPAAIPAVATSRTFISPIGVDTLSGLVDLLSVTNLFGTDFRDAIGFVSDDVGLPAGFASPVFLRDFDISSVISGDRFSLGNGVSANSALLGIGTFLVRDAPADSGAIPEPAMIVIWSGFAVFVGLVNRRRC